MDEPTSGQGVKTGQYDELHGRGIIEQATPEIEQGALDQERLTVYCGFDPTASSLHVGTLVPILGLVRLQRAGHRPIAVVGGGTGLIGDPSGKTDERKMLTRETVEENVEGIRAQLARFLDFESRDNPAVLVNNAEWLGAFSLVDFLRDIGKHFRVNAMLQKESVRSRLEDREHGMSFTEFSYMLLQAADFLHLYDRFGCTLQIGGSDQWGNITAGIELIRRLRGAKSHGMTFPLLMTASGTKFGKSEAGTVWLDAERTSPYEFYQFWVRCDDRDVVRFLRLFTFLDQGRIAELEEVVRTRPDGREAQRTLAREVTALVHGEAEADKAIRASQVLFGEPVDGLDEATILGIFADVPSVDVSRELVAGEGWPLVDALVTGGSCKSKGEARRLIQGGGVYLNNHRVAAVEARLTLEGLASEGTAVLRSGKKSYLLVRVR